MELIEVETINLRDICLPYGCLWSEDDTLSILTENEIHILKLKPNIRTIENTSHFIRQTIKPRDEYPNKDLQPAVKERLHRETRFNLYNMLNDVVLTPDGKNLDCHDIIPRCVQCCWSPAGVVNNFQCALLFLSNTGNVDIQICQEQFWVVVVDLTKLYVHQIKETWVTDSSLDYETLKSQTYQACTACIGWSPMYEDNKYSFVVMGQLNGDILIWKTNNFMSTKLEYLPTLVTVFITNMAKLTAVHWVKLTDCSALILVADISGIIKGYEINNIFALQITSSEHVYWQYNDDIRIDKIFSERIDSNFLVFAVKRSNIVVFLISNTGVLLSTKIHRVGNLFITDESLTKNSELSKLMSRLYFIQVPSTPSGILVTAAPVNGFQRIKNGCYAICTHTSYVSEINVIIKKNQIVNIESCEIKQPIDREHLSAAGICASKNKAMWIICTNYCKLINHLIIREPLQLIICLSNYFNAEDILLKNPTQKLLGYWDCLELFRILSDKVEAKTDIVDHLENYDNISLYRLKIYYWIAVLSDTVIKKKKRNVNPKIDLLPSAEEFFCLIKLKYGILRLRSLIEVFNDEKSLTNLQLHSVRYVQEYLIETKKSKTFKNLLGEATETELTEVLDASKHIGLLEPIKCSFCDEDIYNTSCSNGHQDNQCIVSFVPFSSVWYSTCPFCTYSAHPELEGIPCCVLCDNFMMFHDYKYLHDNS